MKKFAHVLSQLHDVRQVHFRAEPSVILACCDDSNSEIGDIYETVNDGDYICMPSGQSDNSEAEFEHEYNSSNNITLHYCDD